MRVVSPVAPVFVPQVVLGFVCEVDYKLVAKAIRHCVTAIKHQREKRRLLMEEALNYQKDVAIKKGFDLTPPPSESPNQKPAPATSSAAASLADNKVCSGSSAHRARGESISQSR